MGNMKKKSLFLLFLLFCYLGNAQEFDYPTITQNILAFPTADGFGKYATGGRGGQVVTVNTLEDDENGLIIGSLRWALKQYPNEPITIVFNVSGHIRLKSILSIRRTKGLTIAGQTAPGDGICISGHKVLLGFSQNLIFRNIRIRCGSIDGAGNSVVGDQALGAENIANSIFDHCSFGWSGEEISTTSDSHFLTFQYCILHEGLYDAGHLKGQRGYGMCWGGSQTTMHHNLLAHNYSRSPRFTGAQSTDYMVYIEYLNNVNYNWGKANATYGGEIWVSNTKYHQSETNFVGNYYKPGPATKNKLSSKDKWYFFHQTVDAPVTGKYIDVPKWYFIGNVMEGNDERTKDNWKGVSIDNTTYYTIPEMRVDSFIQPINFYRNYKFDWSAYTMKGKIEDALTAYQHVLDKAGCINRDSIERRIIREVKDGTATFSGSVGEKLGIIDDPKDAEGGVGFIDYPHYEIRDINYDSDFDGMPDWWEILKGLNPNDTADRNYLTPEGYTALEVYLCELMGEKIEGELVDPVSIRELYKIDFTHYIENNTLHIRSETILDKIHVFDMCGRCCYEFYLSSNQYALDLSGFSKGSYILWITDKNKSRGVVKFYNN